MHPVFSGFRIYHNALVYCIHLISGLCFHHASFQFPGSFGRVRLGKTNVGCLFGKCRNAVVQSVFPIVLKYIRRPDIGCTSAAAVVEHPFFCFSRYFTECPACKLPVDQIFRFAYLNVAERKIIFLNFFSILRKNGIGGIHVIRISEKFTGGVVNIVGSPFQVIFHSGNTSVVICPWIWIADWFKRFVTARSESRNAPNQYYINSLFHTFSSYLI